MTISVSQGCTFEVRGRQKNKRRSKTGRSHTMQTTEATYEARDKNRTTGDPTNRTIKLCEEGVSDCRRQAIVRPIAACSRVV